MDLAGTRAIVLGGTSGIGLATARQLADAGANVVAGSRSASSRSSAAESLGARVTLREIDVLDRSALTALFEEFAPFDVLVNAATGGERAVGPFLEMDLDGFQDSFRKLWGYANSVRLGAPHMTPEAAIVLVSGFPARKCGPGAAAISTVGNAVEGLVRAIAAELTPRRINAVSPGFIDTPMLTVPAAERAALIARSTAHLPIPRAGTADEVADAILFLLRNDYVTGSVVDVEGGILRT